MPESLLEALHRVYEELRQGKDVVIKLHAIIRTCEERREAIKQSINRTFAIT